MKFQRVIGKIEQAKLEKAAQKISSTFLELALRPDNIHVGQCLGGDPLLFAMLQPMEHVATKNIPTAATDGKRYYWNVDFVNKLSPIGLRLVCGHEAWHAIYMHPQRRGGRNPKLWNICVDYIVNGLIMEDMKFRNKDPKQIFNDNLGQYITVEQYAQMLKNPFKKVPGLDFDMTKPPPPKAELNMPKPDEERELTPEEEEEIRVRATKTTWFYADPDMSPEMKKPEKLYDYFFSLLPKCPECGKVGMYKIPKKKKKGKKEKAEAKDPNAQNEQGEEQKAGEQGSPEDGHDHGEEQGDQEGNNPGEGEGDEDGDGQSQSAAPQPSGSGKQPCNTCGSGHSCGKGQPGGSGDEYIDIFDFGDTLDDHMDAGESPEKMGQRLADAIETAKRMAGNVPGALQDELGQLTRPIIRWKDAIRSQLIKSKDGNTKNDWSRFKSRPLFSGLLIPKRIDHLSKFGVLLDCSGSMSIADICFGVSQLQSIDTNSEGIVVPADYEIYWDKATKLIGTSETELKKINVVGRGGTCLGSFFSDYEKKLGKTDFLICITDGFLTDQDFAEMKNPGIPVYWLITSDCCFEAPFGKVYQLKS